MNKGIEIYTTVAELTVQSERILDKHGQVEESPIKFVGIEEFNETLPETFSDLFQKDLIHDLGLTSDFVKLGKGFTGLYSQDREVLLALGFSEEMCEGKLVKFTRDQGEGRRQLIVYEQFLQGNGIGWDKQVGGIYFNGVSPSFDKSCIYVVYPASWKIGLPEYALFSVETANGLHYIQSEKIDGGEIIFVDENSENVLGIGGEEYRKWQALVTLGQIDDYLAKSR